MATAEAFKLQRFGVTPKVPHSPSRVAASVLLPESAAFNFF